MYTDSIWQRIIFEIQTKDQNTSPDGKRLPPPMDNNPRGVTRTVPAFKEDLVLQTTTK